MIQSIRATNARVWSAIAAVRVHGRNPATMGEVRDALAARLRARSYVMSQAEADAFFRRWRMTPAGH